MPPRAGTRSSWGSCSSTAPTQTRASQAGGFTPLHAAAQNGDRDSVEALLESGADPAAANDDGRTPGELARAAGHDDLDELLP